ITLLAAGSQSIDGSLLANGQFGAGGVVTMFAPLSINVGAVQATGSSRGGDILLFSRDGEVNLTSSISGVSLRAGALMDGGQVRVLAGSGISLAGNIDV